MATFTIRLTDMLGLFPGPDDFLFGSPVGEEIPGFSGDDIILGLAGNDILRGGDGDDRLEGGSGGDQISGGPGDDLLTGGNDNDGPQRIIDDDVVIGANTGLFGDGGDDVLLGNAGNDLLNGGPDNDQLFGGSGGDILDGDFGNDFYTGGSGRDLFNWDFSQGFDTITDFQNNVDTIDVLGISNVAMRGFFGPVINSADRGVGFVNVPGASDEGGRLVIDFGQTVRGAQVLTIQGVHELDVGTEIV